MIDSLFGSRTRVKLLGLFMNNPSNLTRVLEPNSESIIVYS